jgi:hypothetical protein
MSIIECGRATENAERDAYKVVVSKGEMDTKGTAIYCLLQMMFFTKNY